MGLIDYIGDNSKQIDAGKFALVVSYLTAFATHALMLSLFINCETCIQPNTKRRYEKKTPISSSMMRILYLHSKAEEVQAEIITC